MFNREEIRRLIEEKNLITGYIDLDTQLTPNGFDLTVEKVFEFKGKGVLDFSNSRRVVPQGREILPYKEEGKDKLGWWDLKQGAYKIRTNEIVSLPNNLVAIGFSRTSLLRMGAFVVNGVWDASFVGKSEFLLIVAAPQGIRIEEKARLVQLVFFPIKETKGYAGIYQFYGMLNQDCKGIENY